jgi:hypothetical protein
LTWRIRLPVPSIPPVWVRERGAVGELEVDVRLVRDDREQEITQRPASPDRQ